MFPGLILVYDPSRGDEARQEKRDKGWLINGGVEQIFDDFLLCLSGLTR